MYRRVAFNVDTILQLKAGRHRVGVTDEVGHVPGLSIDVARRLLQESRALSWFHRQVVHFVRPIGYERFKALFDFLYLDSDARCN